MQSVWEMLANNDINIPNVASSQPASAAASPIWALFFISISPSGWQTWRDGVGVTNPAQSIPAKSQLTKTNRPLLLDHLAATFQISKSDRGRINEPRLRAGSSHCPFTLSHCWLCHNIIDFVAFKLKYPNINWSFWGMPWIAGSFAHAMKVNHGKYILVPSSVM